MKRNPKLMCATLLLAAGLVTAQQNGTGPNPDTGGMQERMGDLLQNREYVQTVQDLQTQVDAILANANAEFKALLEKDDKSFEEMRQLAVERVTLLVTSPEAQQVKTQLARIRQHYQQQLPLHERPELTDVQKAAIEAQKAALKAKHDELNKLLQNDARYAELLAKADKTREEIAELARLRRSLIDESEAAQALVTNIQGLIEQFREDNPELPRLGPEMQERIRQLRHGVQAVQTVAEELDVLLAEDSPEYAALLEKTEKTREELKAMALLKLHLITGNEDAQALANSLQIMKKRLQDVERNQRLAKIHNAREVRRRINEHRDNQDAAGGNTPDPDTE